MTFNFVRRTANALYRKGIVRRFFKESRWGRWGPKLYYSLFLKNLPFPPYLNIEITNACNLRCVICPNDMIPPEKLGFMELETFRRILAEIDAAGSSNLLFVKQGEPLLHPRLEEFFQALRATRNRQNVLIVTNGTTLTEERTKLLVEHQVDELNVSVDSLNPDVFRKIRGFPLKTVLDNIDRVRQIKREARSPLPRLSVNVVVMRDNISEIRAIRRHFKEIGVEITLQKYNQGFTGKNLGGKRWTLVPGQSVRRYPCAHLFTNFVINWNGSVSLCCHDWNNAYVIGDIATSGIRSLWQSARYEFIRRAHRRAEYSKIPICRDCPTWREEPNVFFPWQYRKAKRG